MKEFRSLVTQASSRPGYSTSRIAKELGFADASPLRKILRNPQRTTSRDRLDRLRGIVGKTAGLSASSGGASSTSVKTVSKPARTPKVAVKTGGSIGAGPEEWVSKSQAKEFQERVEQLRQGGWTVDALAKRLGYHHGRSLRKTLASGNVRRRVFDTITGLSAKPGSSSASAPRVAVSAKSANVASVKKAAPVKAASVKTASAKAAPVSRPGVSVKTTSVTASAKFSDRPAGGVTTYLESARRHLDRARNEVARASTASQLLEPGLRTLLGEIDDLGRRLEL